MKRCPYCQETSRQNKVGKTDALSQRYQFMYCNRKYTPDRKPQGYLASLRKQAIEMYVDGGNLRRIARHLKVHHRTISLWVKDHAAEALPAAPMPNEVKDAEMDELFSFIGDKKQNLYSDSGGSQNTLYFGLGGCLGANLGSDSTND